MKQMVRNSLAELLGIWYTINGKIKKAKQRALAGEFILSIYFHAPSAALFESCVRWLLKNGFQIIPTQQLLAIKAGEIPFPKGAAIITVDDGWRTNINNIVAITKQYKVPVTIFATTEPVEKGGAYWWTYANKAKQLHLIEYSVEQLKKLDNIERLNIVNKIKATLNLQREAMYPEELQAIAESKYITVGSHTVTHPILIQCHDAEAEFEICTSKKILELLLNKPITQFAYPNGDYSSRELELLQLAGYQLAFTTKTHYLTEDVLKQQLELPRFEVWESGGYFETISRITGVWFNSKTKKNHSNGQ
jgi:peptidoglycan/xylan/chitin deacetylase (PgdA/CDA1 family)